MKIGPLVNTRVITVGPGHSLAEAARRMNEAQVGSAVVTTEDGRPGIFTERDLLRAIAEGVDPETAVVEGYMTGHAMTASASWHVVEAAVRMIEGRFRHLIILDPEGGVHGVLSIRDLVGSLLDQLLSPAGPSQGPRG